MGVGFRVSGYHVDALDVAAVEPDRVLDLISGFGFRVSGFGFKDSGFKFEVSGFGFRIQNFGARVQNFK